jgi:hypothetical protein
MIETVVEKIVGPLIGMLSGYFNLPEYGRVLYKRARGKILEYSHEEQFWKDAIGEYFYQPSRRKLFQDNLVRLVDFEITEWFPRCPGLYWTKIGQEYRKNAVKDLINKFGYTVYSPRGKSRMILGGLGTIRLKEHTVDKENYKVLCATSSGKCDAGIPLVISKGVYDEIQNEIHTEGSINADVEGFYSQLPINWEDLVIETPGSEISKRVKSWIAASYYVPRYCLQIGSRLQIKKRKSESVVQATAWTLYGCKESNPLPYSFTFHTFDPKDGNDIKEAAEFIQMYVTEFGGRGILTEFDEVISRFPSVYPLSKVMQSEVDQSIEQKFIMDRAKGLEVA